MKPVVQKTREGQKGVEKQKIKRGVFKGTCSNNSRTRGGGVGALKLFIKGTTKSELFAGWR